ncbi:hypothetical protein LX32DRAFT_114671 [Colletotrichum zoysiae]|uniref:Uncharacterized protein n=1 Tax=Colletotrichum zoysiae TaxID=1216348 RepID=A0AAD9H9Z4_9PEZI|nr:hypothetical protein LX32DRAFT_114671 [Colletotrichum zoysiae]
MARYIGDQSPKLSRVPGIDLLAILSPLRRSLEAREAERTLRVMRRTRRGTTENWDRHSAGSCAMLYASSLVRLTCGGLALGRRVTSASPRTLGIMELILYRLVVSLSERGSMDRAEAEASGLPSDFPEGGISDRKMDAISSHPLILPTCTNGYLCHCFCEWWWKHFCHDPTCQAMPEEECLRRRALTCRFFDQNVSEQNFVCSCARTNMTSKV